jgi:hypothetical protein
MALPPPVRSSWRAYYVVLEGHALGIVLIEPSLGGVALWNLVLMP